MKWTPGSRLLFVDHLLAENPERQIVILLGLSQHKKRAPKDQSKTRGRRCVVKEIDRYT